MPRRGKRQTGPETRVRRAVATYAAQHRELERVTDALIANVSSLLDDAGINYLSVTGRAKSVASFAAKAVRETGGERLYPDPLTDITDQIGVRVITYLRGDVTAVAEALTDQLSVLTDLDMGEVTAGEGRFGYASRHLLLALDARGLDMGDPPGDGAAVEGLRGRRWQVQIRTVLQHAWAEFEHEVRYKGTIPEEHVPDLSRRFTLAAGLLELADREFTEIRNRLRSVTDRVPLVDATDPRISGADLADFLSSRFPDTGWSRSDHYVWISGLLLELGIASLEELAGLLNSLDSSAIEARMAYKYPAGAVRLLDDALLAVFGRRYVGLHGNSHRVPLLEARLEKVRGRPEPPASSTTGPT
ncbi:MAG: GTP pyrophosphokinase [Micrococcales bacterium]|nr:GTP pyrophosphokinase [Micrococcales bacterium]